MSADNSKKRAREDETEEERRIRKQQKKERKAAEQAQLEAESEKADKSSKKSKDKDQQDDKAAKKSKSSMQTVSSSPPPSKRVKQETSTPEPLSAASEIDFDEQIAAMRVLNAKDTDTSPITDFSQTKFGPAILSAIEKNGYTRPTPTQAQSWPICLSGRDIVMVAKTGSGKTCGFLLPAIHRLVTSGLANPGTHMSAQSRFGTSIKITVLVLAPTRELAQQISIEAKKFGTSSGVRCTCLYGGSPKSEQIRSLQSGAHIVVATPGRLNDLIEINRADVSNVNYLVLDEADRMLDMGFEPQIRTIIERTSKERQTLFFTATWPKEVQALANKFLRDPVMISLGDAHNLKANKSITQHIHLISELEKQELLCKLLQEFQETNTKTLVFVSQKQTCNELTDILWNKGMEVDCLHGDRDQWERTKVTNQFRVGAVKLLVATDVAARGLDVKDIGAVINYDFPAGTNGVEDYVHRIGRTGRANEKGIAHTFFTKGDSRNARKLVEVLRGAGQVIPPELVRMSLAGGGRGRGGRGGRGYGGRGFRGGRRW